MLTLLLDEHISPGVAEGIHRRYKNISIFCLAEWEGGRFLGLSDDVVLAEAMAQKMTLVTYDRRTIPPLLKTWAEAGRGHGGVIFVDEKTIPPSDIGGLMFSLHSLFNEAARWDWQNRVCFLRR
jgi:hypothetical protein